MKSPTELKIRDVFRNSFAGGSQSIVVDIMPTGITWTMAGWSKSSTEFSSFEKLKADPQFKYLKTYSKLRWFLKL